MPDLSRSHSCKVRCLYLDSFYPSIQAQNRIFLIKHFLPNLPRMNEKEAAGSKMMGRLRSLLPPPSRGHSRQPSRAPSPVPNTDTADLSQEDTKDALQGARATVADLPKDDDMWAIAEEKLRGDPQKREKLEKYDDILKDHFGLVLKPIGTAQRRGQFLGFLNSEIEHLRSKESETQLGRCRNKYKRFFKAAVGCVIDTKDVITAAATPCLPASVACAGVAVLLSVGFVIIQRQAETNFP